MKGEKRVRTNEMGAGKEYGERDWELRENGRGKGLGEGREEREIKQVAQRATIAHLRLSIFK